MIGLGKPFVDLAIELHEATLLGIIAILVSSDNTRPRPREQDREEDRHYLPGCSTLAPRRRSRRRTSQETTRISARYSSTSTE